MSHYEDQLDGIRYAINKLTCWVGKEQQSDYDDSRLIMLILHCDHESAREILRHNKDDFFNFILSRPEITNKAEMYMQYLRTYAKL